MIYFNCDYNEGAHEKIINRLAKTNMEQTAGYGCDPYCEHAGELIRNACNAPEADVHFLVGGTQANLTVISAALRPWQGVLCAHTGHINVHETGAVEACGHKVLALPATDGKISAEQIDEAYQMHITDESFEHIVQPAMVYLSFPTELGTLYSKAELEAISSVCRKNGLYLFIDGARLGYGLMAPDNDLTLPKLAELCDVFYIGGTKMGALFGEAVVICSPQLKKDFRYIIKQKGGMLAKGRLLGIQFETLFQDNLYWKLGKHADDLAEDIRSALKLRGIPLLVKNRTNQIFPIFPDSCLAQLKEKYSFTYMEQVDGEHSAIRFCTSWATTKEQVKQLCEDILKLRY